MDQYNEVQSLTRALIEETTDARDLGVGLKDELAGLAGILHQQQRLMRELQHLTSQTRMAPVETIVPRLQRNVRQTAAATHKQASLVVVGHDILVDAEVLNQLIDPLLHILRNAVDHGLETPDEREAAGKPRAGTITLTVARRGQVVTVQVADDGRGLNLRDIRSQGRGTRTADRRRHAHATPRSPASRCCPDSPRATRSPRSPAAASASTWWRRACARSRAPSTSAPKPAAASRSNCASRRRWWPRTRCSCATAARCSASPATPCARAVPAVAVQLERENGALFALVDDTRYPGARAGVAHRHARAPPAPSAATSCSSTANPAPSACWSTRCSKPANS